MKIYELDQHINKFIRIKAQTTSKGNQIKYTNGEFWFKGDLLGYEGMAEVIVSDILNISTLNKNEYVEYYKAKLKLITGDVLEGCVSKSFITDDYISHITFMDIMKQYGISYNDITKNKSTKEMIFNILELMYTETKINLTDYLRKVFTLDAITLNEDRHLNNLSVLYNSKENIYLEAPIFDNGLSLLSDTIMYPTQIPTKNLVGIVKSKPFSTSFKKQYNVLGKGFTVPINELEDILNKLKVNLRIRNIINHSIKNYPEVFTDESKIKSF